jgi:hypothetical protein
MRLAQNREFKIVSSHWVEEPPKDKRCDYAMKESKSRFASLKSIALLVLLSSLILASGFIATKTLLSTGTSIESSGDSKVKEGASDSNVKESTGDPNVRVSSGDPDVQVWVNTNSGVYHCPNTRWYGNTKHGKYMTQKEAQSKGYRPAHGIVCG